MNIGCGEHWYDLAICKRKNTVIAPHRHAWNWLPWLSAKIMIAMVTCEAAVCALSSDWLYVHCKCTCHQYFISVYWFHATLFLLTLVVMSVITKQENPEYCLVSYFVWMLNPGCWMFDWFRLNIILWQFRIWWRNLVAYNCNQYCCFQCFRYALPIVFDLQMFDGHVLALYSVFQTLVPLGLMAWTLNSLK